MILSVDNIHKSYGKEKVLKGITFQINHPQIIALVGPNGSGKSTLLNIITNILTADTGKVTVLGNSNQDPHIFRDIAYMQDNSVLYDYLTGYDHLQFIGDMQGSTKQNINATTEKLGITQYMNKKVKKYSLGMKQHLLLAMAILNKPKLLILDEPMNGLDPTSAILVRGLLIELHAKGTTILLSSHNLAEIDRVTPSILFLKNGKLMEEDISKYEKTRYFLTVSDKNAASDILKENGFLFTTEDEGIQIYQKDNTLQAVLTTLENEGITIHDIDKQVTGSEERYKHLFVEDSEVGDAPISI